MMANQMRVRTGHSLDAIRIDMLLTGSIEELHRQARVRPLHELSTTQQHGKLPGQIIYSTLQEGTTDYSSAYSTSENPVACPPHKYMFATALTAYQRLGLLSASPISRQTYCSPTIESHAASCDNIMFVKGAKSMAELI
jgi:hypothetical protein